MSLRPITPDWPAPRAIRAACSTREGGVSVGLHAGLNLGRSSGDDPAAIDDNRQRLFAHLGLPGAPEWIRQVHGTRVVQVPHQPTEPEADAAYTTQPGIVCAVQAADCLPVLFCDDDASVVAAAHAGWRGLSGGVLENTVAALPVVPGKLMAWLGPAIGPDDFEVGAEVRAAFVAADPAAEVCFRRAEVEGKYFADLFALARQRLARAGVTRVYGGGISTFADPERFYSFRRDGICGRMAALIWIEPR